MRKLFLAAVLAFASVTGAQAAVLYQNDFESGSAAGFTGATTVTTAPTAVTKYLGPLSLGQQATLNLNTAGYSSITLSFDLYTILSLDGAGFHCCGPDVFTLNVNGASTLLSDSFTNWNGWVQSYGGYTAGGTGSDPLLTGQLGYDFWGPDHTYHLSFVVPVTMASMWFNFIGGTDQGWADEGFGIDNIMVTGVEAVPEPEALALLVFGLAGAYALRRRRIGRAA